MLTRNDFLKRMGVACVLLGHAYCLFADEPSGCQRFADDADYLVYNLTSKFAKAEFFC